MGFAPASNFNPQPLALKPLLRTGNPYTLNPKPLTLNSETGMLARGRACCASLNLPTPQPQPQPQPQAPRPKPQTWNPEAGLLGAGPRLAAPEGGPVKLGGGAADGGGGVLVGENDPQEEDDLGFGARPSPTLLIVPLFRGSSRFESLIVSHHSRYKVTCECNKEDEAAESRTLRTAAKFQEKFLIR